MTSRAWTLTSARNFSLVILEQWKLNSHQLAWYQVSVFYFPPPQFLVPFYSLVNFPINRSCIRWPRVLCSLPFSCDPDSQGVSARHHFSVCWIWCSLWTFPCAGRLQSNRSMYVVRIYGSVLMFFKCWQLGFNGAETSCRIAHILGILLMNSYKRDIFLVTTIYF